MTALRTAQAIVYQKSFGAAVSKSINTVYQAATDGIVVAYHGWSGGTSVRDCQGLVGSSNPPTTTISSAQTNIATGVYLENCFPVLKDQYYKCVASASDLVTTSILFIPLGV